MSSLKKILEFPFGEFGLSNYLWKPSQNPTQVILSLSAQKIKFSVINRWEVICNLLYIHTFKLLKNPDL